MGSCDQDRKRRRDKLRGVTGCQKLWVASSSSPKYGCRLNLPRCTCPVGMEEKGLLEGAWPRPVGQGRLGGGSRGLWFLGGPCEVAAVLGVQSVVPPGMWDADRRPCPWQLQGRTVAVQGPLGAYKSQKIKFFPAKSIGRASLGPVVPEMGSRCSFCTRWVVRFLPMCLPASVSPSGCSRPCRAVGRWALRGWGAGFGEGRRPRRWLLLPWGDSGRGAGAV